MKDERKAEPRPEQHVLVVDDEKPCESPSPKPPGRGISHREAAEGSEAFAALRGQNVDVVLLDMRLKESGEDGIVLLKRIKKEFPRSR